MDEKTPEELQRELEDFQAAAAAGLIDNPANDPPDVAEVGNYG